MRVCLGDLEACLGSKPADLHHSQQLVAVRNGPSGSGAEKRYACVSDDLT